MGTRAWGRLAFPVAKPLTRDVGAALLTGTAAAMAGAACALLHRGDFDLGCTAAAIGLGLAWSLAFSLGVHLLRARRGARLVALALALGALSGVVDVHVLQLGDARSGWLAHSAFALGFLGFPAIYALLWGKGCDGVRRRRRYDPIDPLGA